MDKEQLRVVLQKRLLDLSVEQASEKSSRACRNLVSTPQFQDSSQKVVMMFLSIAREVDTSEAILAAWQMGKIVAVPRISWQQRHMIPVQINSLQSDFSTDISPPRRVRNPTKGVPVPFNEIDLVVTPGLAFDAAGNRLGRGSSYYDRFFANKEVKALRCGLAFAEQLVESVPVTATDVPMNFLVTDEKIMYFNPPRREQGQ